MNSLVEGLKKLLVTALANTVIAGIIWALGGTHLHFGRVWLASQCIGFACMLVGVTLYQKLFKKRRRMLSALLAACIGVPLGAWLAFQAGVPLEGESLSSALGSVWRYVLLSLVISFAFHIYYANQEKMKALDQARREAELRELTVQKAALNAELRALQAQIEPHFLFNTLANLHSLIGRDDASARRLLEQLNEYLRATLAHSRAEQATLGDECRMLSAYLAIQAQRMGARLSWFLEVPEALLELPFPPMLLQPLVENAVLHGVEPKLGDASVTVSARQVDGQLRLAVVDDGCGLGAGGTSGVGLANVCERLAALFGTQARLEIKDNSPCGVIAELWIKLDAIAS
jgi:LytS/YehU family sensor histidine kinase